MGLAAASGSSALTARERFSEDASAVWLHATSECRRLGQFYVGVEHLFLGLLSRQPAMVERLLTGSSLGCADLASALVSAIGIGPDPDWERIRVTPRSRKVLGVADVLSVQAGQHFIEPIHLLAAILVEGESVPARVLTTHGFDLRAALESLAQAYGPRVLSLSPMSAPSTLRRGAPTPYLDRLGRDIVVLARSGAFDPLIGRERELELVLEILCRRTKNNPVLLGEAGVGKTAIVEGLAQRLAAGHVPPSLQGMRLVQVSASRLLTGSGSHAEDQVRQIIEEVSRNSNIILFVDEMHTLAGGNGADAASLLKPPLARGLIRCIGATTTAEYRRFIEGEPALERRFQPVIVDEPGKALTLQILKGLRERYEIHHGVSISDQALNACVSLSAQYLRDRQQPDKAIDLMDQSAARVAIRASGSEVVRPSHGAAHQAPVSNGAVTNGVALDDTVANRATACDPLPFVVTSADVAGVLGDLVGMEIPLGGGSDPARLRGLDQFLADRVLGQPEATAAVAQVIRVAKRELDLRPSRPDGVILLVGPGGVGKTSLARAVCEFMHGEDEDALVRLDMSEYSEPHSLARLVGPPPGYIGYEEEGQLTGRVRTRPDCVLILDEIDRAHPSVRAIFMQVFDEGRLSDSRGRCIHFDHTTIIMTTGVGAGADSAPVGFRRDDASQGSQRMLSTLAEALSSDFLSRIDRVIPLKPLTIQTVEEIAERMLLQVADRLRAEGKEMVIGEGVAEVIARHRYNQKHGVRHIAPAIEDLVIEPLAGLAYRPEWGPSRGVVLDRTGETVSLELMPCCD